MSLSNEDSLRVNVLIVNSDAIRIDDGPMIMYGLLKNGDETKIQLNPNCKDELYVKQIRELLSSTVLGSPGGFPIFLKRWTRMGQVSSRLDSLLMLGEPEAVIAVCGSKALNDELARRAWWAMPNADNARRMLKQEVVVNGKMGKVLAEFLVEFLPFEQEPFAIIESVRLILQSDLVSEEVKQDVWKRGQVKSVFRIGFLHTLPNNLPQACACRPELNSNREHIEKLSRTNRFAKLLYQLLSQQGQSYIKACEWIIKKPNNQDSVVAFLDALAAYLNEVKIFEHSYRDVELLINDIASVIEGNEFENTSNSQELKECLQCCPEFLEDIKSMLLLAHADVSLVSPIFAHTDAVGSVMRKKIKPVTDPLIACFKQLQGELV